LTEGPKYGMGMKLKSIEETLIKSMIVGPGDYDVMDKDNTRMKKTIRYSMGTSVRTSMSSKFEPGPGNYNVSLFDKKTEPVVGFGSSKRENSSASLPITPGPGNYKINGLIGNEGSKSTIHSKLPEKS
jgi:hypothetical protein